MNLDLLLELLINFLDQAGKPLFLTGKAGTGKTTFLRYIKSTSMLNLAIVAPTAVAAINAGGVTINSFFQMPPAPFLPNDIEALHSQSISNEKMKLLQCLELLIIDEISMVRADTLDYIDTKLKYIRGSVRPFGGVKVLMIGDLYQLPPVYQNDWHILNKFYSGPYFFNSLVLTKAPAVTFELMQVHRQSDPVFIDILNGIRKGSIRPEELSVLNRCYKKELQTNWVIDYVTLSTHNKLVNDINQQRLNELPGMAYTFKAKVTGEFNKDAYPADEELVLKEGAQVMFIKNDSSGKKQYYNGKTARIVAIEHDRIQITFLDDHTDFDVKLETWTNVTYAVDNQENKINENSGGTFTQYPLRLAWAITIHKSQGLTFDKVIVDVDAAFAHGQSYVALSRCRSLEGLILKSPVRVENIFTDRQVTKFTEESQDILPNRQLLEQAKLDLAKEILVDIFDFSSISTEWNKLKAFWVDDEFVLTKIRSTERIFDNDINVVGRRFINKEILAQPDNSNLWITRKERMQKAASYFYSKLREVEDLLMESINAKQANDFPTEYYNVLNRLMINLKAKCAALAVFPVAISQGDVLSAMKNTMLNHQPINKKWTARPTENEKKYNNPDLYKEIINWRNATSKFRGIPDYSLLSEKVIRDISQKTPKSLDQLASLKSFGKAKADDFGEDILQIVRSFLRKSELF